ncbi:ABC transporter permease [Inquilinus limosus]|uniref:ABC transporter permease n=1 Tax=Inquilinus limosus TaxID=171674 RepID=UPI003F152285
MRRSWFEAVRRRPDAGTIAGTLALILALTVVAGDDWLSVYALGNILRYTAIIGLIAIGQALMLISREIDLSVGSVYGIGAIAFISFEPFVGVTGSFITAMILVALIGAFNGLLSLKGRVSSMIITLGALFFYRGAIYVTTGGTARSLDAEAREHYLIDLLGGNYLFGFENALLWLFLCLVFFSVLLSRTAFGNHVQAVGGDETSALARAVRVGRVKWSCFVLCSTLAGFSGIVTIADTPHTHVTLGEDMELESIASAVIGGCLLSGGRGSILGAVLGAFIISAIRYELIAMGAPPYWFISFVGIVLVLAVMGNTALAQWLRRS